MSDRETDGRAQRAASDEHPVAGLPSHLPGERKVVTVMFADVSGFTTMAETMDPERVRDVMNGCFERLVPIVAQYGGTVDKFIGDEIMALFGAPVAHENDPERALRAALDMMAALAGFNAAHATDLGLHFGINTGLVIAGGVGTRGRHDYSVMGDTVNVAARLKEAAARGEILVGPDTARLTSHAFAFETRGPLRVRGKAERLRASRLLGRRTDPEPTRGLWVRGISSPLVGRDAELAALTAAVDRLLAGQGGVVTVVAEAGLGKSRLLAEVRDRVAGQGLRWLEGRTLSFSRTVSYWPFLEILKGDAGIAEHDDESAGWEKLERRIAALFPGEEAEVLPYLATLLALEVRGELAEQVRYLDGEAMGRQIFRASRRFCERLARRHPLVLVCEDWHWADESSAALLEHLLPLVAEVPLLLCCVSRPDRDSSAARLREIAARDYAARHTEIILAPLSAADSAQLVHNLLAIDHLPPRMRGLILHKAEGNPFFVEEVIRALIDMDAIVRDDARGCWRATDKVGTINIPDTLHGVITARVDRLDEEVKQLLGIAAVIGRSFFYRILAAVAEAGREVDRRLGELQQLELIRERRQMPELEYVFKHALVHEAAYESILLQRRRELHRRVGQCVETLFAGRLDEFFGLLAYHYARAEDWPKAQEYLLKAGDQAGSVAADAEALAHYRDAIAAYARTFGDRWDPLQQATLERKMGEALYRRGDYEQAMETCQRALTSLGSPLPASGWPVRRAIVGALVQQLGHRLLPAVLRGRTAGRADPAVEEQLRIYEVIAKMLVYTDPERLLLDALLAANLAERRGSPVRVAQGLTAIGVTCDFVPLYRVAGYYHRRALALAEQTEHPDALGHAYTATGFHHHWLGDRETARHHYERATTIYRQTGDLRMWAAVSSMLARLAVDRGDLSTALAHAQEVRRAGQEGADRGTGAMGLHVLAETLWYAGAQDAAVVYLGQAVELYRAVPEYLSLAVAGAQLGHFYLRRGEARQALAVANESSEIVAERRLRGPFLSSIAGSLAEAYLAAAEQTKGRDRRAALRQAGRAAERAVRMSRPYRDGMAPWAYRVKGTYEWLRGKPKAAQAWWQRAVAAAEETGPPYALAMVYLEMGARLEDPAHLARADAIFAELHAALDPKQVQELSDPAHG